MGGFSIPLIVFHLIGLAFYRGYNWKISTGITLFVGSTWNIFVVMIISSIKYFPAIVEVMGTTKDLDSLSDYLSGFTVFAIFMGLEAALYVLGKSTNKLI